MVNQKLAVDGDRIGGVDNLDHPKQGRPRPNPDRLRNRIRSYGRLCFIDTNCDRKARDEAQKELEDATEDAARPSTAS